MKIRVAALASALANNVAAFWRMPCRSRTGLARIDPLVYPGEVGDHVHTFHGGGSIGLTTTYQDLAQGKCTSCEVTQDKSAYWTPVLYFIFSNGTTVIVPQVGGMLAYYLFYLDNIKAFPEGFQMIAGNKEVRNFTGPFPDTPLSSWPTDPTNQFFLQQRAIGFNCLNYATTPEPSLYRHVLPTKEHLDASCADGLRLELAFPSCGNGSIDSADHKSHVAYPSLVKEGNCPAGFETHYPFLFFETIWATNTFKGQDGRFVIATGDPVGTGYHGDFIMGWESADFLQQAATTCGSSSGSGDVQDCPLFTLQTDPDAAQCTFSVPEELKDDDPLGPTDGLPVNVPIQYGPAEATEYPIAGGSGTPTSSSTAPASPSTSLEAAPLSYSPANPSSTSTALGDNAVAQHSSTVSDGVIGETNLSAVTTMPTSFAYTYAPLGNTVTSYVTSDDSVLELVVEETDVIVMVTATATETAAPYSRRRRHLDGQKHLRHDHQ